MLRYAVSIAGGGDTPRPPHGIEKAGYLDWRRQTFLMGAGGQNPPALKFEKRSG
jgi:hypothetical protein